jgi:hypothetical protein
VSAESVEAPDFAEAIEAWRVWRVVGGGDGHRLGSVIKPTLWPAGAPLVAECLKTSRLTEWFQRRRGRSHDSPDRACECGIYAAWLPEIHQYLNETPQQHSVARVLGEVSLWGTVIECDRGFRAAFAYPLRIYVPVDSPLHPGHRWEDIAAGLETYGVPVELLPARCAEAVHVLEQKQLDSFPRAEG